MNRLHYQKSTSTNMMEGAHEIIMKLTLFILFIMSAEYLMAQAILLEKNISSELPKKTYGINETHFVHSYIGAGFLAGPSENKNSTINYGTSAAYYFGTRYKYKICQYYALGFDLSYNYKVFEIAQNNDKIFPSTLKHDNEDLRINNLSLEFFQRFNLNKIRGNVLGTYIDIGVIGDYVVRGVHRYTNVFTAVNEFGAGTSKVKNYNLNYLTNYNYGAMVRLGFNHLVFFAQYRLDKIFVSSSAFSDFPRISTGVQINFY